MPAPKCSKDVFAETWAKHGGRAADIARDLGVAERNVYARRIRLEREGYALPGSPLGHNPSGGLRSAYRRQIDLTIEDGTLVAFGDMHSMPVQGRGGDTPAMGALLALLPRLKPTHLIDMGDAVNGGAIGRHPPLGWERKASVEEELVAVQHDKRRIVDACPDAEKAWVVGNHDERFDRRLAQVASDFEGVAGFRLEDHFPGWPLAWSVVVNGDTKFIHRWHGGVHARWNNVLKGGGGNIVTGDTHRLGVTSYTGQFGTLYGIECGTLADPRSPDFEYTRGIEPNWQPGFVVLRWRSGVLQPPEICYVDEAGVAWFRGEPVRLKPCNASRKKRKSSDKES
jgi:hypothetical protein